MFVNVGGHMIRAEKIDVVGPVMKMGAKSYFEVRDCNGNNYTATYEGEVVAKEARNKLCEQLNEASKS